VALGTIALAAAVLGASASRAAVAAPAQQAMTCRWQNIGTAASELFQGALAMDTDQNIAYWYGGAGTDLESSDKVEAIDLSAANLSATARPVSAGGALAVVGAAGAYRAKGAKADGSAVYFFGGLKDGNNGLAINNVQRLVTKTGRWEQVTVPTGALVARAFAMAAYDPDHDVLWVFGGVSSCQLQDVLQGQACQARPLAIQYLTFDPMTGEPREWKSLGTDITNFGGVADYDSTKKRVILHGGTRDIKNGQSVLQALDLADPDPSKAKLAPLTATGNTPSLYFHGGAYDASHNWLVVYGGVKQNYFQSNEATDNVTMALDLGAMPNPTWRNLSPSSNPSDRVAGGLVYDPKHMAVVQTQGRQKITFTNDTPPMPAPRVQRSIQALTCTASTVPTETPVRATPTQGGPTLTPRPTSTPGPTAGPPIGKLCPGLDAKAPAAVIADALANPDKVNGWGQRCRPGLPPSAWNTPRTYLSLRDTGKPYHPLFNGLQYKCGCP